mmetsp:Transcript_28430/g.66005  ORF Transcript_28430/g.66005 Transcript_28430/m.66005 type:complete len:116 (+) Transcript_28430:181-528(+)
MGILFSALSLASCEFLQIQQEDGSRTSVGLYTFHNDSGKCIRYDEQQQSFSRTEDLARTSGLLAPLLATFTVVLVAFEFCCCRFPCSRLIEGLGLMAAQILQGLTLLFVDSKQFW